MGGDDENEGTKLKYNDIAFVRKLDFWEFQINNQKFFTKNSPKEVEDIKFINYNSLGNYQGKPLYFVSQSDPMIELKSNMYPIVQRISDACLIDEKCEKDLPEKNCSVDNVIIVREPTENEDERIYQEENCIFIIASYQNQSRYSDAFLFNVLGIV